MHRNIKRFGFEGTASDDADFPRLRAQFETLVVQQMRGEGYVPVIGLGPFWATVYRKEDDIYEFKLSVHGVYVGRKQACLIEGITAEGRTLTLRNKLNPS